MLPACQGQGSLLFYTCLAMAGWVWLPGALAGWHWVLAIFTSWLASANDATADILWKLDQSAGWLLVVTLLLTCPWQLDSLSGLIGYLAWMMMSPWFPGIPVVFAILNIGVNFSVQTAIFWIYFLQKCVVMLSPDNWAILLHVPCPLLPLGSPNVSQCMWKTEVF